MQFRWPSFALGLAALLGVAQTADAAVSFINNPTRITAFVGQPFEKSLLEIVTGLEPGPVNWAPNIERPAWLTVQSATSRMFGTPTLADVGVKTFRLGVAQSESSSAIGIVEVTVKTAPVWSENPILLPDATEDVFFSFNLTTKVSVAGGGNLTFTPASPVPAWINISAGGLLSGTPRRANVGAFGGIFVTATSPSGGTATVEIRGNVKKVLKPPKWTQPSYVLDDASEDAPYQVAVTSDRFISNVENVPLTYSLLTGPTWLTLSPDGTFKGTPLVANIGPVTARAKVSGTLEGTLYETEALFTFVVRETNDAPVWKRDPVDLGSIPAGKPWSAPLAGEVTDEENNPITFSLASGPTWATISAQGVLQGTPPAGSLGVNEWVVHASDGTTQTDAHVRVNVINVAPKWLAKPTILPNAPERQLYDVVLTPFAQDDNGDALTFNIVNGPSWATIIDGRLRGTPPSAVIGLNTFLIRVSDAAGGNDTAEVRVTVLDINDTPEWTRTPLLFGPVDERVVFSVDLNPFVVDPDIGDTKAFAKVSGPDWATLLPNGQFSGTPLRANVGLNPFRVRVTDKGGLSTEVDMFVTVSKVNQPPIWTRNPIDLPDALEDAAFQFAVTQFVGDEDGDTLSYKRISGPTWLAVGTNGTLTGTPKLADVGNYEVVIEVTDGLLVARTTARGRVTKKPRPPTLNAGALAFTMKEREVLDKNLNDPAFVVAENGLPLSFELVSPPSWATLSSTGALHLAPLFAQIGVQTLTIRVFDSLLSATGTVQVTVQRNPRAPVWTTDAIVFGAQARTPFSNTLVGKASDLDGLPLTFTKTSGPGWLTVNLDGTLSGTPGDDAVGVNPFTIEAKNDLLGASKSITINVAFKNHPPVVNAEALRFEVKERATFTAQLSDRTFVTDVDPTDVLGFTAVDTKDWFAMDGDGTLVLKPVFKDIGDHQVRIRISDGTDTVDATIFVRVVRDPRAPVWSENPIIFNAKAREPFAAELAPKVTDLDGLSFTFEKVSGLDWLNINGDGTLSGTPGDGNVGDNEFVVRVKNDAAAALATVIVRVLFNPKPPVLNLAALEFTVKERAVFTENLADPRFVQNPDGTPLSFQLLDASDFLTLTPAGALRIAPAFKDIGTRQFSIRVSNGPLSDNGFIKVTVVRDPRAPVWSENPILFTANARQPFTATVANKAQDLDGLPLTFSKDSGPDWLTVADNGALSGTPPDAAVGVNDFQVIVKNDQLGATTTVRITVNPTPHPPKLNLNALVFTVKERATDTYNLNDPKYVTHVDATPLAWTLLDASDFVTLTGDGQLKLAPQFRHIGPHQLRVRVVNGSLSDEGTLQITVVRDPRPPVWSENPILFDAQTRKPFTATLAGKATDLDGLSIRIAKVDGPAWLTVSSTGALSGTPPDAAIGDNTFTVRAANDLAQADVKVIVRVKLTPHPPILQLAALKFTIKERAIFSENLNQAKYVTNVDGTPLTFSLVTPPAWVTLSSDGVLKATPQFANIGTLTLQLVVANGTEAAQGPLTIEVIRDPRPPQWKENPIVYETLARVPFAAALKEKVQDLDGLPVTFSRISGPAWLTVAADGRISGTPGDANLGDNTFVIRVSNDKLSADANIVVRVLFNNHPPVWTQNPIQLPDAELGVPYFATLNGRATDADPQDTLTYSKVTSTAWIAVAGSGDITGTPTALGIATLRARVTDSQNASAEVDVQIRVVPKNNPPVWSQNPIRLPDAVEDAAFTFDLKPLVKDADNTPITITAVSMPAWMKLNNGVLTGTPAFADIGDYSAVFSATDGKATVPVNALGRVIRKNVPPVVVGDLSFTMKERETLSLDLALPEFIVDENGDKLVFTAVTPPAWITLSADGKFIAKPLFPQVGDHSIPIRVSDGAFTVDATVKIRVLRDPRAPEWLQDPIVFETKARVPFAASLAGKVQDLDGAPLTFAKQAGDPWMTVNRDGSISGTPGDANLGDNLFIITAANDALGSNVRVIVKVLFNNHPPTWTQNPIDLPKAWVNEPYAFDLRPFAADVDTTDSLTFTKDAGPAWLQINPTSGELSGSPLLPDVGLNTFRFRVTDSAGASAVVVARVVVEKRNVPPKWSEDPIRLSDARALSAYSFDIKPFVTDEDNDPIAIRLVAGPEWLAVSRDGKVSGTPQREDVGDYSALFDADDGRGGITRVRGVGRVLPKAQPPLIHTEALFFTVKERAKLDENLAQIKFVEDLDGLPLNFELLDTAIWVELTQAGRLTAEPLRPQVGDHQFRFRVSNGQFASEGVIHIKVLLDARPPIWSENPIRYKAKARQPFVAKLFEKVTDPDGGTLTFTKKFGGDWLTVDAKGNLYGTAQNDLVGENQFVITARNEGAASDVNVYITVEANNQAPYWVDSPIRLPDARIDKTYLQSIDSLARDFDPGDKLTFLKLAGPDWAFVGSAGTIMGTPERFDEGIATVRVRVLDPWGAHADASLIVHVRGPNAPRWILDPIPLGDVRAGNQYAYDISPFAKSDDNLPLKFRKVSGPTWLLVAENGTLSGKPAVEDVGPYTAIFAVTDGNFEAQTNGFGRVLPPENSAPVFEVNAMRFTLKERETLTENLAQPKYIYDPDGDAFTVTLQDPPSWITLTAAGELSLKPLKEHIGDHTFTVRATDVKNHSSSGTLFVRVIPDPRRPIWSEDPIRFVTYVGQVFAKNIADKVTDPDGDTIAFLKVSGPEWMAVAPTGSLSGTPTIANLGTNTFRVLAKDTTPGTEVTVIVEVKNVDPINDQIVIDEPVPNAPSENTWVIDNSWGNGWSPLVGEFNGYIGRYYAKLAKARIAHSNAYLSTDAASYDGRPLRDPNTAQMIFGYLDGDLVNSFVRRLVNSTLAFCYNSPIWSIHRHQKTAANYPFYKKEYVKDHVPVDMLIATMHGDYYQYYARGKEEQWWTPNDFASSYLRFAEKEKQSLRISVAAPQCLQKTQEENRRIADIQNKNGARNVLLPVATLPAYAQIVERTKGDYFQLSCSFSLANVLDYYADKVIFRAYVHAKRHIPLTKKPIDPLEIELRLAGATLAKDLWRYDAATNTVEVDWYRIDTSVLKSGDRLEIRYRGL